MAETVKLSVEFPRSFIEGIWADEEKAAEAVKQAAVVGLYHQRRITLRKGAELLSLSYRGFLDLMSQHSVSPFTYEEGWLERELAILGSMECGSS